jgi:hypothetical protein
VVAAVLALTAAIAYAASNTVDYTSKLTPRHPKAKKHKPANIGYEGTLSVGTTDGSQPDSAPTTVIYFPKQLITNAKHFPSCKVSDIDGQTTVPAKCKKAVVGSGTATSLAGTPGSAGGLQEQLIVTAYNGPRGKQLLLDLNTAPGQPVPITNRVIPGTLGKGTGPFGFKDTFTIPTDLQNVGGLQVAQTHFDVKINKKTVKVKGKKVSYLQLGACPKSHKLPTRTVVNFSNLAGPPAGPAVTVNGTMPC